MLRNWLGKIWIQYRWHLLGVLSVLVAIFIILIRGSNKGALDDLSKWLLKSRVRILDEAVERHQSTSKDVDTNIELAKDKIEELKIASQHKAAEVDKMTMEEAARVFKSLGY